MTTRTTQGLQYLNSRNSWIRMSSAVDILKSDISNPTIDQLKDPANYDNSLAKKYILQGGTLNENGTLKSGAGLAFENNAYSRTSAEGIDYRLGIRPMPGITNIEVKSLGAYGSLREVTVNFNCWDIHQLEDLELLYMRPGYTVLVEWGWAPYFDENGNFKTTVEFYDIVNTKKNKETIWKELDEKMAKNGNYEAMFGYVKNYSWNARMDGGYDCTTTIISLGEVIESLKVNYVPSTVMSSIKKYGYLLRNIKSEVAVSVTDFIEKNIFSEDENFVEEAYSQNVLAGLFYELYTIGIKQDPDTEDAGKSYFLTDTEYGSQYNLFRKTININGEEEKDDKKIGESDEQLYVTLESLCDLLNNYVLLQDGGSTAADPKPPFSKITVRDLSFTGSANNTTGDGYLLALAHPLQVSMDPRVCLIKNMLWADGISINLSTSPPSPPSGNNASSTPPADPVVTFSHNLGTPDQVSTLVDDIISIGAGTNADDLNNTKPLIDWLKEKLKNNSDTPAGQIDQNVKEVARVYLAKYNDSTYKVKRPKSADLNRLGVSVIDDNIGKTIDDIFTANPADFYELLEDDNAFNLDDDGSKSVITPQGGDPDEAQKSAEDPVADEKEKLEEQKEKFEELNEAAKEGSAFLKNMELPYYVNNDYKTELGIIGNIYLNVRMLYELAIDANLQNQDKKEKNEISLYDFIKSMLAKISPVIGNVNNFDIVTDEKNNAKIVDINFVSKEDPETIYKNAFELQLHNLNSVVRSYKLESKIFPDQANIVAVGAQVEGGALGIDTTTFVAFNKSIRDRIIPVKNAPPDKLAETNSAQEKLNNLLSNLELLLKFFGRLKPGIVVDADFDVDKAGNYQNALKDLINYLKSITTSKTNNKAILPTVLSISMDGIGGLIIGNLFKINTDILPKGYKGSGQGGVGPNVGYLITGIGHSVGSGDWVTKIDAQTTILDAPQASITNFDYSNMNINVNPSKEAEVIKVNEPSPDTTQTTTQATTPPPSGKGEGCVAKIPNLNSISDSELDIVKGPFTSNSGTVTELAVIDGKPVGKDVAKALILMKRAAAKEGVKLIVNSGFRSPYTSIDSTSSKGTKVSASSQDSLYAAYLKNGRPLTAKPGTSNHGNAFAFDLNTGSTTGAIKSPLNKSVYQWLISNAYKFGFVRYVAKEEWHWEYRPGTYQYNERVPKNNKLYNGMNLNCNCV